MNNKIMSNTDYVMNEITDFLMKSLTGHQEEGYYLNIAKGEGLILLMASFRFKENEYHDYPFYDFKSTISIEKGKVYLDHVLLNKTIQGKKKKEKVKCLLNKTFNVFFDSPLFSFDEDTTIAVLDSGLDHVKEMLKGYFNIMEEDRRKER